MTAVPRRTQWQARGRARPTVAASRHTTPQSTTLGFNPVIHVPNYMNHYSFTDPRDGWLSWPCWLTDSGGLNRKVVTHPASSLAQDRESSPAETTVLTTMLRHQPRPLCSRLRPDVRDRRQTSDRQTSVKKHRLMPPPNRGGA